MVRCNARGANHVVISNETLKTLHNIFGYCCRDDSRLLFTAQRPLLGS